MISRDCASGYFLLPVATTAGQTCRAKPVGAFAPTPSALNKRRKGVGGSSVLACPTFDGWVDGPPALPFVV